MTTFIGWALLAFQILFGIAAVGLFVGSKRYWDPLELLGSACFGVAAITSYQLTAWWPLAVGFGLLWIFKWMGLDPGDDRVPHPVVIRIVRIYFAIGLLCGTLIFVSYVWGVIASSSCFPIFTFFSDFVTYLIISLTMAWIGILGFYVRSILWLPSLVHWYIYGPEPSFVFWLMPGIFVSCGSN